MKPLTWVAIILLVVAAAMLTAGIGTPSLWIAVIAVGAALVAIGTRKPGKRVR
jgi:hypothetical protein